MASGPDKAPAGRAARSGGALLGPTRRPPGVPHAAAARRCGGGGVGGYNLLLPCRARCTLLPCDIRRFHCFAAHCAPPPLSYLTSRLITNWTQRSTRINVGTPVQPSSASSAQAGGQATRQQRNAQAAAETAAGRRGGGAPWAAACRAAPPQGRHTRVRVAHLPRKAGALSIIEQYILASEGW